MASFKSALTKWVVAVLSGVACAPSAWAADPNVASSVTPLPSVVTYSRVSPVFTTYAAYEISITNNSNNTLNNVRVEGITDVVGSTENAPFVTSVGLACSTTTASQTAISCSIGQLRGGGDARSFVVVFKTPTAGSSIRFDWTHYYSEGPNDNGAHNDTNSGTAVTALGTPTATELKTFALPGNSFFTGLTGIASSADAFTTKVTVPAFAKAEVVESTFTLNCTNFLTCWQTDLTIPGTFSHLTIVLSQDASNIKPGTKIGSVVLRYEYLDANSVLQTHIVGACANATTPRSDGLPCIASSVQYKKNTPGWTQALDGDFVWTLISTKNGRITIF